MEYIFYNSPNLTKKENYLFAKKEIINVFARNNDLIAIFEYGRTNNPGISDLDIILVLKDKLTSKSYLFNKSKLSKKELMILDYANIMIFPENRFNEILIWDNLNLNQIYGEKIVVNKYNSTELDIARIVDWLPERIIRIQETINSPTINIRKTLGLCKSCSYSLINLKNNFGIDNPNLDETLKELDELRNNWFKLKKLDQEILLIELLSKIKNNLILGLNRFEYYLSEYTNDNLLENTEKFNYNKFNKFCYLFKKKPIKNRITIGSSGNIFLNLSFFYMLHFMIYASQDGLISKNIRKDLNFSDCNTNNYSNLNTKYIELLKNRISLCNYWASYLKTNSFNSGLFKMGWFFS